MALDPAEQHLRHVEKDVLIPKIMREKARERCSEQVEDFTKCCKDSGILMVIKCRKENSALKGCLTAYCVSGECVWACACHSMCGGQKTTFRSWFSSALGPGLNSCHQL
ncbi:COX assembly mitochondrial protein homolog isoform X1 [Nannospalax galili]|uniref:COX assembly mitochondrial protein homolog isoform X1 n=1 Tax=Nannospalax galili TaxID=1026970 RepID=UPI00081A1A37|nr:COX assembly mitochondrial protein homolog isoform X1 [Nannospalax galili]